MSAEACVFCRIVAGRLPATVRHEDDLALAFDDIHPWARTHVLIVPKKHLSDLGDAGDVDRDLLGHLLRVAATVAAKLGVVEDGYRIVVNNGSGAGQVVFHLHLHLLSGPRTGRHLV